MATIDLGNLNINNLGIFNVISSEDQKPRQFIEAARERGDDLSKYAYYGEVPVGVIVSEQKQHKGEDILVITHLAVLEAYAYKFDVESTLISHLLNLLPKRHLRKCYLITKDPKLSSSLADDQLKLTSSPEASDLVENDQYSALLVSRD